MRPQRDHLPHAEFFSGIYRQWLAYNGGEEPGEGPLCARACYEVPSVLEAYACVLVEPPEDAAAIDRAWQEVRGRLAVAMEQAWWERLEGCRLLALAAPLSQRVLNILWYQGGVRSLDALATLDLAALSTFYAVGKKTLQEILCGVAAMRGQPYRSVPVLAELRVSLSCRCNVCRPDPRMQPYWDRVGFPRAEGEPRMTAQRQALPPGNYL